MEVVLIFFLLVLLPSTFTETKAKVDALIPPTSSLDSSKEYVYNVELSVTPPKNPGPEAFVINLLSSVLGSKKAAKKAYLWNYGIFTFAAYLTREQAKRLGDLHDVESVAEDVGFFPPVHDLRTTNFAPQESGL